MLGHPNIKGLSKGLDNYIGLMYAPDYGDIGPYIWSWNQDGWDREDIKFFNARTMVIADTAEKAMFHPDVVQSFAIQDIELVKENNQYALRFISTGEEIDSAPSLDALMIESEAVKRLILGEADIASLDYHPAAQPRTPSPAPEF